MKRIILFVTILLLISCKNNKITDSCKLITINGYFQPAGVSYSLDEVKNTWYVYNSPDINIVDTISYLSKSVSESIKSCFVNTTIENNQLNLLLYYNDTIIFNYKIVNNKESCKQINKFNFEIPGPASFDAGYNYSINITTDFIILSYNDIVGSGYVFTYVISNPQISTWVQQNLGR